MSGDPYTFLMKAGRPQVVATVREALDAAGIPYRSGLLAGEQPSVIFTVPRERLDEARVVVEDAAGDEARSDLPPSAQKFPVQSVLAVSSLILLHFLLVFWMVASADQGRGLIRWGALLKGGTADEPWRLVTSLLLHLDPLHAFWNAASMMVFAVPLLGDLGYVRTGLIYLASGIGGGISALTFAAAGTMIVGSSGAVAGLFGAWVVLTMSRVHLEPLTRRAVFRILGIAMLMLPSLISPITSTGHSVSVSSHLGGLATGMAIGALISFGLLRKGVGRFADTAG
jgi:membrane associated rhomboid family serine protease